MLAPLDRRHEKLLGEIFRHPIPRDLAWADVVHLIDHVGRVVQRHDGKVEFSIGATRAVFRKPHGKERLGVAEVYELRRFLTAAGLGAAGAAPSAPARSSLPTVVAIDHHRARIFEPVAGDGARLEERDHLAPADPGGYERQLVHREKESHYRGQRIPEPAEYYERVAQRLAQAHEIAVVGDGTGKSSAASFLVAYLERKHPELAGRIVTVRDADLSSIGIEELENVVRSLHDASDLAAP